MAEVLILWNTASISTLKLKGMLIRFPRFYGIAISVVKLGRGLWFANGISTARSCLQLGKAMGQRMGAKNV